MGLSRRVSVYVAVVMAVLSVVLVAAGALALLSNAARTDRTGAVDESVRAQLAINDRLDSLTANAVDWSMWDATYDLMGGENPGYFEANVPEESFANLGVNVLAFYDGSGQLEHVRSRALPSGESTTVPGLERLLRTYPGLNLVRTGQPSAAGVLRLPRGNLMMTAAGPILPSDQSGPMRGTLVMGRLLDAGEIASISKRTQLPLSLSPISANSDPTEPRVETTRDSIIVSRPLVGVSGRSLVDLNVTKPRAAWTSASTTLFHLALAFALLSFVTTFVMRRGVSKLVIERILVLNAAVGRIRVSGIREPLALRGDDELSSLARNVDDLVSDLDAAKVEVETARDELELRVEERTAELERAVADLKAQISRREVAEAAWASSEQQYQTLIENLSDVVFTMSPDLTLRFVSSAVQAMFGTTADGVVGCPLTVLVGEKAGKLVRRRIRRGITAEGAHLAIDSCVSAGGALDLELVLTPLREGRGYQGILRDITARRRHENELLHMASHDFLTGLWNRRRFEDELSRELVDIGRGGRPGAVLWLDLDRFKDVNDTLGHKAGDELLTAIARRLSESVRADSIVARLGGDEFAVLLPGADREAATNAAERLAREVGSVRVDIDGQAVRASTSLGVVLYPDHGTEVEELLARADVAMYRAKELGRSRYVVFDPSVEWKDDIENRRVWTEMVELALSEGGLVAYAQPIHDVVSAAASSPTSCSCACSTSRARPSCRPTSSRSPSAPG